MVTAIDWGVETVVEINEHLDSSPSAAANVNGAVEALKSLLDGATTNGHQTGSHSGQALEVVVLSDVLPQPFSLRQVQEAADLLRRQVLQATDLRNSGKGKPVVYRLLPISLFMGLIQDGDDDDDDRSPSVGETVIQISPEHLDRVGVAFEELLTIYRRLNDYATFLSKHRFYLSPDHAQLAIRRSEDLQKAIEGLRVSYGRVLRDVRTGAEPASAIQDLLQSVIGDDAGPLAAAKSIVDQEREKVEFVANTVDSGALYIGHNNYTSLLSVLAQYGYQGRSIYVMFFSKATMRHDAWPANQSLLVDLLSTRAGGRVVIVDCDVTGEPLETSRIAEYQSGEEVTDDMLEKHKFLADKCLAQAPERSLETENIHKPVKRRYVKIPCPGPQCDSSALHSWFCPSCFHVLEYGHSDSHIYCECGRSSSALHLQVHRV